MSFTRRQIIEAGVATGALGLMASSPLLAAAIDAPDVRRRPDMAPAQPAAADPHAGHNVNAVQGEAAAPPAGPPPAEAFSELDSVDIAAAKTAASIRPQIPGGNASTIKVANAPSGVATMAGTSRSRVPRKYLPASAAVATPSVIGIASVAYAAERFASYSSRARGSGGVPSFSAR